MVNRQQKKNDAHPFSDHQIRQLKGLGVIDEQIKFLQTAVMSGAAWFSKPPKRNDVNEKLSDLLKLTKKLEKSIDFVLCEVSDESVNKLRLEVEARLLDAAFIVQAERHKNGERIHRDPIEAFAKTLKTARDVCEIAYKKRPTKRRDPKQVGMRPAMYIYDALVRGWGEKYYAAGDGELSASSSGARERYEPFPFKAAARRNTPFYKICEICWKSFPNDDGPRSPYRSICAYINWCKQRDKRTNRAVEHAG